MNKPCAVSSTSLRLDLGAEQWQNASAVGLTVLRSKTPSSVASGEFSHDSLNSFNFFLLACVYFLCSQASIYGFVRIPG